MTFILWSSENFNLSWSTGLGQYPAASAVRSRAFKPPIGTTTDRPQRLIRREADSSSTFQLADKQWNSSYWTFLHMMNISRTWTLDKEVLLSIRNVSVQQVPALVIEWIRLDVRDGQVREGYPFIVACKANGSKRVRLSWFKDGHPVDPSSAILRNVSVYVHHGQDLRGFHTLNLEVKQAVLADRGEYECRASDWEQSRSASVFLDVVTPPVLDLMPANPSVLNGSAVYLTCRDENHLARRTATKYVWFKDGQQVDSSSGELVEDLTPVGTLLKIRSVQQSANYTCRGLNVSMPGQQTTRISVVSSLDQACPAQTFMGINWTMTAHGMTNFQFCPSGYVGAARRLCSSSSNGGPAANSSTTAWDPPDFSHCAEKAVAELQRKVKLITLGYAVTDVPSIVSQLAQHVRKRFADAVPLSFLPGEGNFVLELARSLEIFLQKRADLLPVSFWTEEGLDHFRTLDILLDAPPPHYFRPDDITPILRLLQNHMALLAARDPNVRFPTGRNLQQPVIGGLQFSFRTPWPSSALLPSILAAGSFSQVQPLAPAQLILAGSNRSDPVETTFRAEADEDEGYLCALLPLRPLNHSAVDWDVRSCQLDRRNGSLFHCLCSQPGTTLLIRAEWVQVQEIQLALPSEPEWSDFRIILAYLAVWGSHLVVTVTLAILAARWYRRRTLWAYLRIQLGLCLVPLTTAYLVPSNAAIEAVWTILVTASTYQYLSTLLVRHQDRPEGSSNRFRPVGFSFGVTLMLAGVHSLLEELSHGDGPFVSWLVHFRSVSGILFCMAYSGLILAQLALYASSSTSAGRMMDTKFRQEAPAHQQDRSCLFLAILSLPTTGFILTDHHFADANPPEDPRWPSLGIHSAMAVLHLGSVVLWAVLVLAYSDDGFLCCAGTGRTKVPATSETVTELLDAAAGTALMMDSPPDEHPPTSEKRSGRIGRASSPLLERAGLGPEVQRAFGLVPSEEDEEVRMDSGTTTVVTNADDLDSGFGPSGGGGSQKLTGFAWKILWRIRWMKIPFLVRDPDGSFRSRQSTMSSSGGGADHHRHGSVTTAETEVTGPLAPPQRRSRTRWTEDYGEENELDSLGRPHHPSTSLMMRKKPFRGRCFIRCSPEKPRHHHPSSSCGWEESRLVGRPITTTMAGGSCCERCWHNPETPYCDLCLAEEPSGRIFIRAVIEKPPPTQTVGLTDHQMAFLKGSQLKFL